MGLLRRGPARSVQDRIGDALTDLKPLLRIHPTVIEVISFDASTGVATLRVEGDCPECEMPAATYCEGIAAHLRMRVPEVRDVRIAPVVAGDG